MRFDVPSVAYARRDDELLVAYQVVGDIDAGLDLIFLLGWPSHLAMQWELPAFARFLTRLGTFSRLITFDRPGTGLSDRGPTGQVFEDRLDDIYRHDKKFVPSLSLANMAKSGRFEP